MNEPENEGLLKRLTPKAPPPGMKRRILADMNRALDDPAHAPVARPARIDRLAASPSVWVGIVAVLLLFVGLAGLSGNSLSRFEQAVLKSGASLRRTSHSTRTGDGEWVNQFQNEALRTLVLSRMRHTDNREPLRVPQSQIRRIVLDSLEIQGG